MVVGMLWQLELTRHYLAPGVPGPPTCCGHSLQGQATSKGPSSVGACKGLCGVDAPG